MKGRAHLSPFTVLSFLDKAAKSGKDKAAKGAIKLFQKRKLLLKERRKEFLLQLQLFFQLTPVKKGGKPESEKECLIASATKRIF